MANPIYTCIKSLIEKQVGSPDQTVKNLHVMQETWVRYMGQEGPLEKGMATHSSILDWSGQWSLVGYSPWGRKESDTTERLTLSLFIEKQVSLRLS